MYHYKSVQLLPISFNKAWDFFVSPFNFSPLTSLSLDFKIWNELNGEEITEGMIINYSVRPILKIHLRWKTEICNFSYKNYFTFSQSEGSYKNWGQKHIFKAYKDIVNLEGEKDYKIQFGFIGKSANKILVEKK